MSDSKEQFFSDMWYQQRWWAWLFFPLSCVFWLLSICRRYYLIHYVKPQKPYAAPVVVIGNITVGGVGKTPLLISICEALSAQRINVGVVSRGYGSTAKHFPLVVNDTTTIADSGDEPALIYQRTKLPVVIGPDRHAAVEFLLRHFSVDLVLSDDGLQHYGLWRDAEIVVVDGKRGLGNGFLLPAGPLRETQSRLKTVDLVCINGASGEKSTSVNISGGVRVSPFTVSHAYWRRLGTQERLPLTQFNEGQSVHAIAGIGNPQRFFTSLENLGLIATPHIFDDHYQYQQTDIIFTDNLPVVTTEKDAVKIEPLLLDTQKSGDVSNYWALGVSVDLPPEILETLIKLLPHK